MKITRTMPDGSALHVTAQTDRGHFSVTADWPAQRAGFGSAPRRVAGCEAERCRALTSRQANARCARRQEAD